MSVRNDVIYFCQSIGRDPLLVQGAGGNVSWKDGEVLWVKASGTWLADAGAQDIFVPVDLGALRVSLDAGDFDATPKSIAEATLRPSIETLLHALMPHKVVVHLHPVEILASLVREDAEAILGNALVGSTRWVTVPYRKPGAALAQAVAKALTRFPEANVIFLQNHGVVLGADDIAEVELLLQDLLTTFKSEALVSVDSETPVSPLMGDNALPYFPLADTEVQRLALDESLYRRLSSFWVLYPDHAVFLGRRAACYDSIDCLTTAIRQADGCPELVFVRGCGVYAKPTFSHAKQVQLRCYYDILVRVSEMSAIRPLTEDEIAELLDWDAEKYRMEMTK